MAIDTNISWNIYNEEAVKRLQEEDPDILPQYTVDSKKDLEYNKKQINSAITSAIVQGKSIDDIADDLQNRISSLNRESAVKTARTAITNAQNGGKLSSLYELRDMGIDVQKEWKATLDSRTRQSHRDLDGQRRELEEPFSNGLQYPGASGPASERYNCRCTLVSYMPDVDTSKSVRWSRNLVTNKKEKVGNVTFIKWAGSILRPYYKNVEQTTTPNGIVVSAMSDHALLQAYDRKVKQEEIVDAIVNPLDISEIKYDGLGRPSQRFLGKMATVNINPVNFIVTTAWRTSRKRSAKHKRRNK